MDIARRRLANQRLTSPTRAVPADVVRALGAVQSQDYASAKWAVALRARGVDDPAVERALTDGSILRTHVLRPTWHFVAPGRGRAAGRRVDANGDEAGRRRRAGSAHAIERRRSVRRRCRSQRLRRVPGVTGGAPRCAFRTRARRDMMCFILGAAHECPSSPARARCSPPPRFRSKRERCDGDSGGRGAAEVRPRGPDRLAPVRCPVRRDAHRRAATCAHSAIAGSEARRRG